MVTPVVNLSSIVSNNLVDGLTHLRGEAAPRNQTVSIQGAYLFPEPTLRATTSGAQLQNMKDIRAHIEGKAQFLSATDLDRVIQTVTTVTLSHFSGEYKKLSFLERCKYQLGIGSETTKTLGSQITELKGLQTTLEKVRKTLGNVTPATPTPAAPVVNTLQQQAMQLVNELTRLNDLRTQLKASAAQYSTCRRNLERRHRHLQENEKRELEECKRLEKQTDKERAAVKKAIGETRSKSRKVQRQMERNLAVSSTPIAV